MIKNILINIIISCIITLLTTLLFNINSNKTLSLIFINTLLILTINNFIRSYNKPSKNNSSKHNPFTNNNPSKNNSSKNNPSKNNNSNSSKTNKSKNQLNKPAEWTDDHIIPLKSYNQCDCTNDNSCIIQPDSNNIFPGFNPKTLEIPKKLEIKPEITNSNNSSKKNCKICGTEICLSNSPVTENFTTYDPYRPHGDYESPESINTSKKMKRIINKVINNIKNNKPNSDINLQDIKLLSKDLCIHCKTGLCLNDSCYSI